MKIGGATTAQYKKPEAPAGFGAKFILAVSVIVSAGCAIGYIMEMNSATTKGYQMKHLEKTVVSLRAENAKMSAALAEMQSMQVKEQKINMMGMVEATQVEFMTPPGPVAVAR